MAAPASKRPSDSPFKQQTLKAWRPILTPRLVIALFAFVGVVFVPIGVGIIVTSNQIEEVESSDYNGSASSNGCCIDNCTDIESWTRRDMNPCTVNITLTADMTPPIYMYYKLSNFYQNHRRYVRSRSDPQLKGSDETENTVTKLESACTYHYSTEGSDGNSSTLINPCGLIAWSYFNDSFALFDKDGAIVSLDSSDIAWASDLELKFHNSNDGTTGQNFPPFAWERSQLCTDLPTQEKVEECLQATASNGTETGWCYPGSGYCTEDPHFVVWMRSAGLPSFRKLYAKIDTPLYADRSPYQIVVSNGVWDAATAAYINPSTGKSQDFLYPVGAFGGTKKVVLSEAGWIGGKNFFLGYAYVVVGIVCLVLAICFFVKHRFYPRELGTAQYVSWWQPKDSPVKQ
mmetsp:Transcript_61034/g.120780  ORF Transcript_61034/g.120780 Transcript_61034/m.120780 type:complete len:402 (-) Transcript_61034:460-1665(-)